MTNVNLPAPDNTDYDSMFMLMINDEYKVQYEKIKSIHPAMSVARKVVTQRLLTKVIELEDRIRMLEMHSVSIPCPGIWLGEEYSGCAAATDENAPDDCPSCGGSGVVK